MDTKKEYDIVNEWMAFEYINYKEINRPQINKATKVPIY